jgi:XRE family transcriptional regulator, regulator of sulfur utilization
MRSPKIPELLNAFAIALKAARADKKISQDRLAYCTGISRVTIARIELGQFQPTISVLFHLCRGLEINPADLIEHTRLRLEKDKAIQSLISPIEVAELKKRRKAPKYD